MRIITALFPEVGNRFGNYKRLADALVESVLENSPSCEIDVFEAEDAPPAGSDSRRQGLIDNTQKMVIWEQAVSDAKDGETICLIDCDTIVLGDLREVENIDFDVCWTVRPVGSAFPFNSGVVFARINDRSRQFFSRWKDANVRLLYDRKNHEPLRAVFGGINQASLGEILVRGPMCNMVPLACEEWNCEDSSWHLFSSKTKVLHIKSGLRRACLGSSNDANLIRLAEIWRKYDRRAQEKALGRDPGQDS